MKQLRFFVRLESGQIIVIFLLLFVVILSSCRALNEGVVTQKWHEAESEDIIILPIGDIMIPFFVTDDEDFVVRVKGNNKKGKEISRKYYIPEPMYDTLIVGEFICISKDCQKKDTDKKSKK